MWQSAERKHIIAPSLKHKTRVHHHPTLTYPKFTPYASLRELPCQYGLPASQNDPQTCYALSVKATCCLLARTRTPALDPALLLSCCAFDPRPVLRGLARVGKAAPQ